MFTGYNLKTHRYFEEYYLKGSEIYSNLEKKVKGEIDNYVGLNGKIDGSKIQNDWFPSINADIFISHSHKDRDIAIGLAGWLEENFGLKSFVDSCVWGYANNLLKQIDDAYCKNTNLNTYDYDARNYSTSHVHMMLSTALYKMIDKAECVLLLNTSNSVQSQETTRNTIINKTESPWIYAEIVATNLVRRKKLSDYRKTNIQKGFTKFANESVRSLEVEYDADLSNLTDLNDDHLGEWYNKRNLSGYKLDYLYQIVKPCLLERAIIIKEEGLGIAR